MNFKIHSWMTIACFAAALGACASSKTTDQLDAGFAHEESVLERRAGFDSRAKVRNAAIVARNANKDQSSAEEEAQSR